ncbi:MAG TPA: hypothetical protein VJH55_02505 [Candidatus Paceibacterota bacterium]
MKKNNTIGIIIIVVAIFIIGAITFGKQDGNSPRRVQDAVACAQDVKRCSDGSFVDRVAPSCEFAACTTEVKPAVSTAKVTPKEVVVKYTDLGFVPKIITINKGDTVKFVSEASRTMWPASDVHPTHLLYPEFDAEARLITGQSYSFTFSKVGTWPYHNHTNSNFGGTVIVK